MGQTNDVSALEYRLIIPGERGSDHGQAQFFHGGYVAGSQTPDHRIERSEELVGFVRSLEPGVG